MEHHGTRRVPLGVLYAALAVLVAWAGAYRVAVSAAGELIDRVFVAADAFASGAVQYDDMTVVAVRLQP